jgi:hypothetical protein
VIAKAWALHPRQSYDALDRLLAPKPAWQKAGAVLQLLGYGLGGLVDVDRPVYLVVTEDKRVALSIDVVPGMAAKVAGQFRLAPGDDGGFHAPPGVTGPAKGAPFACEVVRAAASGFRLVCGGDLAAVRALSPMLAEMTADPNGPDVHVEIPADALRNAVGPQAAAARSTAPHSASFRAGEAIGQGFVSDFVGDLDAVALDASLATDLTASLSFRFHSDASPTVHALAGHPGHTAAASPAFWRLPADATMAFFTAGAVAEDLAPLKTVVLDGLAAGLKESVCPEESRYLDTRFRALLFTGGPLVVGVGNDLPVLERALEKTRGGAKESDSTKQAARGGALHALAGWVLVEVDEPGERWTAALREISLADAKFAGCTLPAPPEVAEPMKSTTTAPAVTASWHLPAGTLHLADRHTPRKDAPAGTRRGYTSHVYVVPDGDRTWIAMGEDEATLVAHLKVALRGARAETLEARSGLESLRGASLGGGFLTVQGVKVFGAGRGDDAKDERFEEARESLKVVRALPSHGTTPYPFTWRGAPLEIATDVRLPVQTILELVSLLE